MSRRANTIALTLLAALCALAQISGSSPAPGASVRGNLALGAPERAFPPPGLPAVDGYAPRPYNVIFVVVDALRADRMGWEHYRRDLTPNLDQLAQRSVLFDRAYSPSNRTSFSIAAYLTGLFPSEIRRGPGYFIRISPKNPSLAGRLKRAGYLTLASLCHFYFRAGNGTEWHFDHRRVSFKYNSHDQNRVLTAPIVTDQTISLLRRYRAGRYDRAGKRPPFFLFSYYLDPHVRYLEHPRFRYGRRLVDRYDGEIRYWDHHFGRLLRYLERSKLLDNTIIVLTADHGEAFGEHGLFFHGVSLYEEQIRVPLLVHVPGRAHHRVRDRVSAVRLPRTILDLVGVAPAPEMRGPSLYGAISAGAPLPATPVYAEVVKDKFDLAKRIWIERDMKLLEWPLKRRFALYDLARDPGEQRNLALTNRRRLQKHVRRYRRYRRASLKSKPHLPVWKIRREVRRRR